MAAMEQMNGGRWREFGIPRDGGAYAVEMLPVFSLSKTANASLSTVFWSVAPIFISKVDAALTRPSWSIVDPSDEFAVKSSVTSSPADEQADARQSVRLVGTTAGEARFLLEGLAHSG